MTVLFTFFPLKFEMQSRKFSGRALLSDDPSLITMALKVNCLCFEQSGSFAPA